MTFPFQNKISIQFYNTQIKVLKKILKHVLNYDILFQISKLHNSVSNI